MTHQWMEIKLKELEKRIKTLEDQVPFMNKPCVANQVCHEDKVKVLDKIKTEIEEYKSTIDYAISEDELKIEGLKEAYTDCLEIIDKYKAETEQVGNPDKLEGEVGESE